MMVVQPRADIDVTNNVVTIEGTHARRPTLAASPA